MASGTRVTNVVSVNETGDLVLTYSFANGLPKPCLDAEGNPLGVDVLNKVTGGAVESTLKAIREMVSDGRIV